MDKKCGYCYSSSIFMAIIAMNPPFQWAKNYDGSIPRSIPPYQGGTARDDCQVGIASQLGSVNGGIFFIQWQ
jgi:hypothetical protein